MVVVAWANTAPAMNAADAVAEAAMAIDSGLNPESIESRIRKAFGEHETGANGEPIVRLAIEDRSQLPYIAREPDRRARGSGGHA